MRRLEINPLAEEDAAAAEEWYASGGKQIAEEFTAALRAAFIRIAEHPDRFHFDRSGFRRLNLKKFPYHILFKERPGMVRIIALRHNKQSPGYGTRRK